MKRIFDIVFAIILIIVFSFPMLIIALSVKLTSKGTVLYWSDRVGKNNKIFKMPKFRTMNTDTPAMATHLMNNKIAGRIDLIVCPLSLMEQWKREFASCLWSGRTPL